MEVARESEYLLSLKVMRLSKPSFYNTLPISCESRDLPGDMLNLAIEQDIGSIKDMPDFQVGQLLMLPQSFSNIFLGECFTSFISVHNDSVEIVQDVSLRINLQTSTHHLNLSGLNLEPKSELLPNESIDEIINHEVKETGTHVLVCAVSYTTPGNEKIHFRRFFRFQVLKPLDVKTKFYNAESDEVYLEAQVQNTTPASICMEKVSLEPSPLYTVRELSTIGIKSESSFGKINYLSSMDTGQYLYCLTPRREKDGSSKLLKGLTSIGKLDMVWRSGIGEKGHLQTSQLQRAAPDYGEIHLTVDNIPNRTILERSFSVRCRIINYGERTMDLVLLLQNNAGSGLKWIGISGVQLGKMAPAEIKDLELTLLPTLPGLQSVSGIRLTDTFLKRTHEYDDVAQVFVYAQETSIA